MVIILIKFITACNVFNQHIYSPERTQEVRDYVLSTVCVRNTLVKDSIIHYRHSPSTN